MILRQRQRSSTGDKAAEVRVALIDAHVHLHPSFDLPTLFGHAAANVAHAAQRLGLGHEVMGVLMLAESGSVDRFGELAQQAGRVGPWHVTPCQENESLRLDGGPQSLIVIAGRQVVTQERLELLALGTRRRIDDGQPLKCVLTEARRANALPVAPWGFGKWTGRRGRVMRELLASSEAEGLFLGDNGARPQASPAPPMFAVARDRGVRILPGTDPLPFAHQQRRAGRYGFMLPLSANEARPFRAIRDLLLAQPAQPPIFGRRDGYLAFAWAQLAMQWHNRMRRRDG